MRRSSPGTTPAPKWTSCGELPQNRKPPEPFAPAVFYLSKKALLQGVPSSADDGIKSNLVIFEDMCLGNDTSHEILTDNFTRNRGRNFVQPHSKKWLCHFFDSLNRRSGSLRRFLRYSALLFKDGAAAAAGDGDLPLAPGHPELLAAVGALEVAVLLVPVDGAAQPEPLDGRSGHL